MLCREWEWFPLTSTEKSAIFENDKRTNALRPVYELPSDHIGIQLDLQRWQAARGTIIEDKEIILIENLEAAAYFRIPILELANLVVEYSALITECGDDPWIGIRMRGKDTKVDPYRILNIDIRYLIYLRASGSLEIHSDEKIIEEKKTTAKPIEEWTDIRIEIQGPHLRAWINDTQYISLEDAAFGGKGSTYLMIHKARAQVKALRVFDLIL
jgi:hypothetical protein